VGGTGVGQGFCRDLLGVVWPPLVRIKGSLTTLDGTWGWPRPPSEGPRVIEATFDGTRDGRDP
jgi:hypothetical protein